MVMLFMILPALLLQVPAAQATGTPAGTSIGNQATATYKDSLGNTFTSTSNQVTTLITAVYSFSLDPNSTVQTSQNNAEDNPGQSQNATPGAIVYFPYTLTNTGNSSDSYTFATEQGSTADRPNEIDPVASSLKVFVDSNGNGVVDVGDSEITSLGLGTGSQIGPVAADSQMKLVIQYQIPASAATNEVINVDLQARSVGNVAISDTLNYSKTNVLNDAVVSVVKAVSNATIDPGGDLTYTFTFTNTGNATATNVTLVDAIPANTTFKASSESASEGTFTFSDDNQTSYAALTTDPNISHIKFVLASLAAANTRTASFKVTVNAAAPATTIPDFGTFNYERSGPTLVPDAPTNTVITVINKKVGVLISDATTPNLFDPADIGSLVLSQSRSGTDALVTDTTTQDQAPAGTYVYFKNVITNNGNASDTFNITTNSNGFPAGSSVSYFKMTDTTVGSNNTSPLLDTNSDSTVDTGVLASGASTTVITRVFIPSDASGTNVTAKVQATSTNGGTAKGTTPGNTLSDTTDNTVAFIITPGVDLTNVVDGSLLSDATTNGNVSFTASANGTTVSFPLLVKNNGASNDTFNLTSSNVSIPGASVQFFSTATSTTLAAAGTKGDSSVTLTSAAGFSAGDKIIINGQMLTVGSVSGAVVTFTSGQTLYADVPVSNETAVEPGTATITSTGVIAPTSTEQVVAVVTIPVNSAPITDTITFTTISTNDSSKADAIVDTVVIPDFLDFTLVANRSGSAPAGGVLFYDHTLTNVGNTSENFSLTITPGASAFTYQILDGTTSAIISTVTNLASGASVTFKVKVIIPAGTPSGTIDNAILTATETTSTVAKTNLDTTTVVSGFIQLVKSVVNTGPAGLLSNSGATGIPGDILEYTIQYSNIGSVDALEVIIKDQIPTYTTFVAGSLKIDGVTDADDTDGAGNADKDSSTSGAVTFYVGTGANGVTHTGGTVVPGAAGQGTVTFRVKID